VFASSGGLLERPLLHLTSCGAWWRVHCDATRAAVELLPVGNDNVQLHYAGCPTLPKSDRYASFRYAKRCACVSVMKRTPCAAVDLGGSVRWLRARSSGLPALRGCVASVSVSGSCGGVRDRQRQSALRVSRWCLGQLHVAFARHFPQRARSVGA